jgi:hypothetical protein
MLFPCHWQDGPGPARAATRTHLLFTTIEVGRLTPKINLTVDLLTTE